ncbi:MAG: glycosyltransferase family 2 protein [Desulfamplus sp.]|nr:glycosyltransferase family 2 protein [Desulfamplus sp.]
MISICLVSHNSRAELELLLPSVNNALKGLSSEILLVDNCCSDQTTPFIEKNYPDVKIIGNLKPAGYGANQNRNIDRAKGTYLAIINPDIIVPFHLFHTMLHFMGEHSDAAMSTCRVCNRDGTSQYLNKRDPALFDLFIRRFLPQRYRGRFQDRLYKYEMRDVGYEKVIDVPFISGCFMFARADVIRNVGGFDDRFFMYFEDADLCRRVRQEGSRILYCPDVSIIHRWERAAHSSLKWSAVFALSALKYYHKWGFKLL